MRTLMVQSKLVDLFSRNMELTYLLDIISSCNEHRLSNVLDAQQIFDIIIDFDFILKQQNYGVALLTVQQLYTVKLYNCYNIKDSNQIIINHSLPVRSRAIRTIRAINFQTIPFLKNDSICEFENFLDTIIYWKMHDVFYLADYQK